MGYLDDYISKATKMRKRKPLKCLPKLFAVIRANKFDPSNHNHVRWKNVALKHGYIDEDMHILKGD